MKFEVENLKCGGCANSVSSGLSKLKGVESVDVELEEGVVEIIGNDFSEEEIAQKLKSMGYPVKGENTLGAQAKSFVSCAIGRVK